MNGNVGLLACNDLACLRSIRERIAFKKALIERFSDGKYKRIQVV